jgi:hypothetical protein
MQRLFGPGTSAGDGSARFCGGRPGARQMSLFFASKAPTSNIRRSS